MRALGVLIALTLSVVVAGCVEPLTGPQAASRSPSGSISVTVSTTGVQIDPDGYTVRVETGPRSGQGQSIGVNASVTFTDLSVGDHDVELTWVRGNCSVLGANPQAVTVTLRGNTPVTFTVTCTAAPLSGKIAFVTG